MSDVFEPLGERILVKIVETEEATPSGIILPDTAKQKPQTAEVVAVDLEADLRVGIGDIIVFAKYAGTEINLEGLEYVILDADDALGIVRTGAV
jgi:chaperonin GroES